MTHEVKKLRRVVERWIQWQMKKEQAAGKPVTEEEEEEEEGGSTGDEEEEGEVGEATLGKS